MDSKDPVFALSIWPGPAAGHILDAAYRPVDQAHLLMIWSPGCLASHYGVSRRFLWEPNWKPFLRLMSDK